MAPAHAVRLGRRTLTVFVCLMLALAFALGWQAWQLLQRDREAERVDQRQRLELAADRVTAALLHDIGDLEVRAAAMPNGLPPGADDVVVLRVRQEAVVAYPQRGLLFYPAAVTGRFTAPADLRAREARCQILHATGKRDACRREATAMAAALWDGRYPLDRAAWTHYREEARRWGANVETGGAYGRRQQAVALAAAAEWAYGNCADRNDELADQQLALRFENEPVLVLCRGAGAGGFDAAIAGPSCVRALADNAPRGEPYLVTLADAERRFVAGSPLVAEQRAVRAKDSSGLPWSVYVSPVRPAPEPALFDGRRRVFVAGFGVVGLVLLAGSYFIVRSIQRESAVAALQTEFVAAVSHEFRTPLTSLRQLSEMLRAGRVTTDEQRAKSYDILARQSERLQRLVESTLDFGRMEAGARRYEFQSIAAAQLVEHVVSEFRAAADGFNVEFDGGSCSTRIRADTDALALALRNLLDNAVKYSGGCRTVGVSLRCNGNRVAIAVTDGGIGIPKEEHRAIFEKFVRGSGALSAHVTGTGLGLALARRIAGAHGGRIDLASEPDRGSTFTIVLPREKQA